MQLFMFLVLTAQYNDYSRNKDSSVRNFLDGQNEGALIDFDTGLGPKVIEKVKDEGITLLELTRKMQEFTKINLIYDSTIVSDLSSTITIIASNSITAGDYWKAYLTALNMKGLALEQTGKFYKIVRFSGESSSNTTTASRNPNAQSVPYIPPIYQGSFSPDTDNIIMKIVTLKHISVGSVLPGNTNSLGNVFGRFAGKVGTIPISQTNTIILYGSGAQINKLEQILKLIDIPDFKEDLHFIPLTHVSPDEMKTLLDSLLNTNMRGGLGGMGQNAMVNSMNQNNPTVTSIVAEPRTNSIIVRADKAGLEIIKNLIAKLDVEADPSITQNRIHVYPLRYSKAKEFAVTLETVISGEVAPDQNNSGTSASPMPRFGRNLQESSSTFANKVSVTADEFSNALVITASKTDYEILKGVIDKLDREARQVYIEGMILDTTITKGHSFGTGIVAAPSGSTNKDGKHVNEVSIANLIGFGGDGSALANLMGSLMNPAEALSSGILNLTGIFGGMGSDKTTNLIIDRDQQPIYGTTTPPSTTPPIIGYETQNTTIPISRINAFIKLLASNSNSNVVAVPQILARTGSEASFTLTDNIPTVGRTITNGTTSESAQNQEVKTGITVTPYVHDGAVTLKITQTASDITSMTAQGAAFNTRELKSEILVNDRETIAMGGFIRDKIMDSESKVPLLGDIPILGWLFKSKNKSISKVNTLFFLTPKIITPGSSVGKEITRDVLQRRNAQFQGIEGSDEYQDVTETLIERSSEDVSRFRDEAFPDYQGIANEIEQVEGVR